ncbi:MAG: uncharacterized SAM-binding protein YcdF (DUF218 family) [Verrucomicrobiales bacterium]|jgi:uncharacterized SAM-binding protein YcdF (DUF218 family)
MFFALSKIASLFLKPLIWFLILSVVALLTRKSRPKLFRFCGTAAVAVLLVFTNPVVFRIAANVWEVPDLAPGSITTPFHTGIVLGGYSNSPSSSPEQLVLGSDPNRLTDAVRLYKTGKIRRILLTGGTGAFFADGISEAPLAQRFLLDLGIPASDILVEPDSRNTNENAVFSAKLLSPDDQMQRSLLITSALHMRRAVACFEKAGLTVVPYSTDFRGSEPVYSSFRSLIPDAWTLWQWEFVLREWIGTLAYRLTGRA